MVDVKKLLGKKAIVIGGSIAGLLSARVLADYFQQVLILERDTLPETPEARRGVPQSVQPHVLFTKGYRILGEFFPDVAEQLQSNGALSKKILAQKPPLEFRPKKGMVADFNREHPVLAEIIK
ncbi:MAG: hypothetical protein RLZZ574_990 [Cyanobacteriota bacterium]